MSARKGALCSGFSPYPSEMKTIIKFQRHSCLEITGNLNIRIINLYLYYFIG